MGKCSAMLLMHYMIFFPLFHKSIKFKIPIFPGHIIMIIFPAIIFDSINAALLTAVRNKCRYQINSRHLTCVIAKRKTYVLQKRLVTSSKFPGQIDYPDITARFHANRLQCLFLFLLCAQMNAYFTLRPLFCICKIKMGLCRMIKC